MSSDNQSSSLDILREDSTRIFLWGFLVDILHVAFLLILIYFLLCFLWVNRSECGANRMSMNTQSCTKDQQPRSGFSINKLNFGLFSPNPVIYHQKTWNIWHVLHGIILWYFCIFFQCLVLVAIHCCGMDECVYGIFL